MGKFTVIIDKDLEDLIPTYLENRQQDIKDLEEAITSKNFNKIESIGHKMAGNAGSYGFADLSKHGKDLENSAINKNISSIKELLDKIINYLKEIDIKFE